MYGGKKHTRKLIRGEKGDNVMASFASLYWTTTVMHRSDTRRVATFVASRFGLKENPQEGLGIHPLVGSTDLEGKDEPSEGKDDAAETSALTRHITDA